MTHQTQAIIVRCEHSDGNAMLRRPRIRCEADAVALTGTNTRETTRFICGPHLIEHLDGINRVVSISPKAQNTPNATNWQVAQIGADLQARQREIRTLVQGGDYDSEEWQNLQNNIDRSAGLLASVIKHS